MTTDRHTLRVPARHGAATPSVSRLLTGTVVLFIVSAMLLGGSPGLSRVPHALVVACFVLLLVKSAEKPLTLRLDPAVLVAAAFVTYALASVLWSYDQGTALVRAGGLVFDFVGAVLVWVALQNGVSLRVVAWASAAAASLQAVVALDQSLVQGMSRADGLTGNPNSLAIQLSMAAFLLLLALPRHRWGSLLALALIVVATVTTGTRKLIFVWFAYVLVLLRDAFPRFARPSVATALVLLLGPLAIWASLSLGQNIGVGSAFDDLTFIRRVESTVTEGGSTDVRAGLIVDAVRAWWEKPVFGHGIDQYRTVSTVVSGFYSHNNYVELLANFGVIGTALFYLLYALIGYRAVLGVLAGRRSAWVVLAILIVFLLMDVARVSYSGRFTWVHLMLLSLAASGHFEPEMRGRGRAEPA